VYILGNGDVVCPCVSVIYNSRSVEGISVEIKDSCSLKYCLIVVK